MFYTMEYTKKPRLRIRYSAISVYILFACSALSRLSCLRLSACGNLLPSSLQCLAGMKHAIGQSVMICFLFPDRTLDFGVRDVSACVNRDVTRMFLHIIQAHIVSIVIFSAVLSFYSAALPRLHCLDVSSLPHLSDDTAAAILAGEELCDLQFSH